MYNKISNKDATLYKTECVIVLTSLIIQLDLECNLLLLTVKEVLYSKTSPAILECSVILSLHALKYKFCISFLYQIMTISPWKHGKSCQALVDCGSRWRIPGQYVGKKVGSCVGGQLLCLPLLQEVGVGVTGGSSISIDVLGDDARQTKLGLSVVL